MNERALSDAPFSIDRHTLLDRLLQEEGNEFNLFPLSFAQERLWFLEQLQPGSPRYNVPAAVRLNGVLDLLALQQSLNEIVARHEALRTTITSVAEQPLQYVAPVLRLALPVCDLCSVPEAAREVVAQQLAHTEARRSFVLSAGPLIRTTVLRLSNDVHMLVLILHHIIADGWSIGVLVRELGLLYAATLARQPAALPALPIQYADYAAWQRDWLRGEELEAQLIYWHRQLALVPALLALPIDRPRPALPTFEGALKRITLAPDLSAALNALSQQAGATLFMVLLAAFQLLLSRYTALEDVLVGSPIAGRTRTETEDLIGLFVNTLVLRADLAGSPRFSELLARVRLTCLGAYAHQDLPFEQLVQALGLERSLSFNPLVQVEFALQNAPLPPLHLVGLTVTSVEVDSGTAKFDLTLNLEERPVGLSGWFEYNTDLFDGATIARLAGHFTTLLAGIVATPQMRIDALPLLDAAERTQLLVEWNATEAVYPHDATLAALVQAQVTRTPDAIAVVALDGALSYAALNTRANQLAHHLRALGVGPDVRVGICVERSLELVIGLLGILKAGGAYVPLDPGYPAERLRFMLQDSGARVLVTNDERRLMPRGHPDERRTTNAQIEHLVTLSSCHLINLCVDWPLIARWPGSLPESGATADNLAYVIYTSGSTGTPKGVAVPHAAINRLICNTNYITINSDDRIALASNASFDAMTFELWGALLAGATLVGLSKEVLLAPQTLAGTIRDQQITTLFLTTALFNQVAREMPRAFQSLRHLLFGGELVERRWVAEVLASGPPERLLHVYGPTESTTFASWYPIQVVAIGATTVPIGRPIANTQIYLLDRFLNPMPVGVVGELYIGGAGLARGYLGRPELAAERFVPNPFAEVSGAGCRVSEDKPPDTRYPMSATRLYKTGDLARYRPDGNIEFLGRVDSQVKLRGFRIELGEIEAVLAQHGTVRACAVLLREDASGAARLVAYVVPVEDQGRKTKGQSVGFVPDLRAFLATRLPGYMLPSSFAVLDALPLTANGKVDRRALPVPDTHTDPSTAVAPRTPEEELLAHIYANVLHRESVGIHDNFFELGGHSLLATQVVAQVRAAFALELPLRTLFEQPTIAGLAEQVREAQQAGYRMPRPSLQPQPRGAVLPLSFAQQRLWFLHQLDPTSTAYHLPYALRLRGALDLVALARAFAVLVARHELLRTTFHLNDGQPTQRIAPLTPRPLVLLDLSAIAPKQQEWLAAALTESAARAPFDLACGPLLRVALLQLAPDAHVLLLTMHHIIADGWSQSVLIRDLTAFYAAFHAGRAPDLPALPIQYADYAIWQQRWLASAALQAQLVAWRSQLAGAPARLELPADYARPLMRGVRGGQVGRQLSPALSAGVQALSSQATATPFMTLLAAFALLLARWSGQEDILVGTPVAGRTQLETHELIGCFLNTLVLRCDMAGNPSFRALLDRVRSVCLHAYANQDVPFEQLLEELQPERALSHAPLFQVFINMLNVPLTPVALPELTLEPLAPPEQGAKFDLTLYVRERAGGFELQLYYDADLFSATRMEELLAQLELVLEQVVAAPEQPIGQVTLVTPAARALLPDPSIVLPMPPYDLVPALVAQWAARAPDQVAVCQGARSWTYAALLAAADEVARALWADQLAQGDVVAVSGPRSFGLIASMLGVLLSGGVLLTLDPELPPARRQQMLQVAGASQLLHVGPRTTAVELEGLTGRWLAVDAQTAQLDPPVSTSLHGTLAALTPDDDAYLFFTSGTSGTPRGVRGWHHALAHFLAWQRERFCVAPSDRCAQLTGLSFDVVLRDIFLPLTSGATLCLPGSALALTPAQVLGWLQRQQITMLHCVPTLAQLWLTEPPSEQLHALRWVGFAGEPLSDALVQRWRALAPGCVVANLYGPTETTLAKACYVVPATPPPGVQPIGVALPQTQTLVLAGGSRLCGIGEVGEIVIRTPFRSRGYHQLPADQQPFRPNPFASGGDQQTSRPADQETSDAAEPQSAICNLQSAIEDRLYHTGDQARYRLDGTLDILGRLDQQVKIRGVRIEPGEVAAVLARHPAVAAVAVVPQPDQRGDLALVAYIVMTKDERRKTKDDWRASESSSFVLRPSSFDGELRAFLSKQLPAALVPSAFVLLDALPLTANGKVNRKALPAPDQQRDTSAYVAPRNVAEELLAGIWATVLGRERIGIRDNFFDVGGHSLLATRMVARVREVFAVELPLRALFDAPTVAELAARIELARQSEQPPTAPPLAPRPRGVIVPLSFAQQRLWFLHQLNPDSPAYHLFSPLRLSGALDLLALARTFGAVIARHEALRTTFVLHDGTPAQQIAPPAPMVLPLLDLTALSLDQREAFAQALVQVAAQEPFDLLRGPLLRVQLLRLSTDTHLLVLTLHHIISDGWSQGVLIREIVTCYTAFCTGQTPMLPTLPVQYADYAIWQREWLVGSVLDAQLAYWKAQLAGIAPLLALPIDHPRPAVMSGAGASLPLVLDARITARLQALSRQVGTTLFMTLLAAFQLLLARYSNQNDIAVGTPIAGRTQAATEGLIGFFVNTLVLRIRLVADGSFAALLAQVRTICLDAYAHQDLPFEQLVEALRLPRNLSAAPLFQVMFALQNLPQQVLELSELTIRPFPTPKRNAKFDLTLALSEIADGLAGEIEYSTDLFDATTIRRLGRHLQTLLAGVVAAPERPIGELSILSQGERHQLVVDWNATVCEYPNDLVVHQLFEAQAVRTPDAVAVIFDNQHLSYAELNHRANQLAHYLRGLGVRPEVRVAIALERSPELLIAVLGVLAADGVYIPLDPSYPTERLAFILDDAQSAVLLTTDSICDLGLTIDDLREADTPIVNRQSKIVNIRADWPLIAQAAPTSLPAVVQPANLAYVIYTSGSTGIPKGVAITHDALINFLFAMRHQPGINAADVLLAVTTVAFDIAALELFLPLMVGARVVLASQSVSKDGVQLAALLERSGTTMLQATPTTWRLLLAAEGLNGRRLKVLCGGEALPAVLAAQVHQRCGQLWNLYGPTETTIWSARASLVYVISDDGTVPIGQPIANTQLYLLDRQMQPVPLGVPGELYIGGAGLARGYLARPDLTAERFVPNPFAEVSGAGYRVLGAESSDTRYPTPGTRLYKTGDLARYLSGGQIAYLGRIDNQVKLRGYRIELGEIETVLVRHPDVEVCAVLLREDVPGIQRLVAYSVSTKDDRRKTKDEGSDSSIVHRPSSFVTDLRAFLAARLPDYMVPAAFVLLDALPLTPNGKLDRQALPAPTTNPSASTYVAPRTPLEAVVAALWSAVLKVKHVGVEDNFFTLGGHSILIMQLIARLEELFPVTLPVRVVFDAPTVGELATALDEACRTAGTDPTAIARLLITISSLSDAEFHILSQNEHDDALHSVLDQRAWSPSALPYLAPLTPERRSLLNRLLRAHGASSAPLPIQPRSELLQLIPLSYSQQRLWFIQQLDPANVAYNIRLFVRLTGPLHVPALEYGLNALVSRHAILRTTFIDAAGEPVQRIAPVLHLALPLFDLRRHLLAEREARALELANVEAYQPFDLSQGPLIRALLLQLDDAEYVFLLAMHHIVCDAWSLPIVGHELAEHYQAYAQGELAPLPEPPLQYADYALWQREQLAGERFEQHITYWKRQLAGAPALLVLPTDRPRPLVQTFHGAAARFVLPDALAHGLRMLSQQAGATTATTLLAAFQLLLARYSGQTDIVVSTSRAERQQRELEQLIGPFYAILLLRAELSGRPSFRTFVAQTQRVVLDAYAHQAVAFEQLVELLKPRRDPSYAPLAQVMFVFHNTPLTQLTLPGLQVAPFGAEKLAAQYDLLLRLSEQDGGFSGQLEYNTDLFDAATIARMVGHFCALLESSVADPQQPISALSLVTESERQQLTTLWQGAAEPLPCECWPQLFEAQAARSPQAVAALFVGQPLTYQELNERANRLAHWLVAQGVGPEVCVGLLAPRSLDFLLALLAVLKAGGVYLPLDPNHPARRIAQVLTQSRCALVLAATELALLLEHSLADLPPDQQPRWVALAALALPDFPTTNLAPRCSLNNLAYVMYTSGSTGAPKGAMVEYAGMHNHMRAKISDLQLSAADTVAQNGPQCFDISVWQFLAPLLVGARVLIIPDEIARDPASLLDQLVQHEITLLQLVPSLLQALVRELEALGDARPALSALRWVIPTGDALTSALARSWLALYPHIPLLNNYGSTECSDDHCHYAIHQPPAPDYRLPIMPIGRAIANTFACVLDAQLAPVPVGVVGEFYTSGIAVGRGYLHNPALTAERFVPNPFADERHGDTETRRHGDTEPGDAELQSAIGTRLYKTGDRVRYLADGSIEFLGRSDARVKIHGLRIELDEVAAALRRHPAVEEAVALVREERPGDQMLVAYVVPAQESGVRDQESGQGDKETRRQGDKENPNGSLSAPQPPTPDPRPLITELRAFLKQQLPGYMVPAAIMQLDALPLTPNGKIDRRALQRLPLPEAALPEADADFVAPQTTLERRLAQSWAEVLGVATVSRSANFFDLGGDSFKAIRVVRQFGTGLTLLALFQYPVLHELAAQLSAGALCANGVLQPLLPPSPHTALSLICVPYGGGSAIVYQPLAQVLPQQYALYSVALPGHDFDSSAESLQSVEQVARRCADEILANVQGPIALYGHCAGTAIAVEITRLLEAGGASVEAVFLGGALPGTAGMQRIAGWFAKFNKKPRPVGAADLLVHLRSLGGFSEIQDSEELDFALRGYLHDDEDASQYFVRRLDREQPRKLNAPIICLMGDRDPATRNYARRYKEWTAFSSTVRLVVVKGGDHYFIKHHAQVVAAIIQSTLEADQASR